MTDITATSRRSHASARPRRHGRVVALFTATALVLGGLTAAAPAAAQDSGATPAADGATMPGPGSMDQSEVTLSGGTVEAAPPGAEGRSATPTPGATGWTQSLDLLEGTQMVALSWDGTTSGPAGPGSGRASLRSRTGDGPWTEWLAVVPDVDDQGGEGTGREGSDVVWLGAEGAGEVEVRVDAGPLVDLELLRLRYHEGQPVPATDVLEGTGRSAAGKAARPTIHPRSAWATRGWATGNSGCGSGPKVSSRLSFAVVHHTASTNSYTAAQVPGLLDGIRAYHQSSLGWCDTAYNFVIDKFGGIWQGRDGDVTKPVLGGHAKGFNTDSVGIALLGQFEPGAAPTAATPTSALMESAAKFLAWKLSLHGLDPNGTFTATSQGSSRYSSGTRVTVPIINPHQLTSFTACPGAGVMGRMTALRTRVAALMGGSGGSGGGGSGGGGGGSTGTSADVRPFASADALVYRQYVDFLRNPSTYEARKWWSDSLDAGTTNRNALAVALLGSNQLQGQSASSVRLYLAYFGRIPDHTGLRFWWSQMDGDKGIRNVSTAFARSPEFTQRFGNLSDGAFVDLVYRNVLGRAPDADGYRYWNDRLRSKRESRGGLMVLFSESGEYQAQRRDVVDVVITHEAMLQRGISTSSMLQWVAKVRDDRSALIASLFTSSEYATRVG